MVGVRRGWREFVGGNGIWEWWESKVGGGNHKRVVGVTRGWWKLEKGGGSWKTVMEIGKGWWESEEGDGRLKRDVEYK